MSELVDFYGDITDTLSPDSMLRELYPDYSFKGVYLDVGAGHPIIISNSYHFRINGWSVYSIDPSPRIKVVFEKYRYELINCGVGEASNGEEFHDFEGKFIKGGGAFGSKGKLKIRVRTLQDILDNELKHVTHIDILDIDCDAKAGAVNVGELDILRSLDFKHSPSTILVEEHNETGIGSFLKEKGYFLYKVDKYNRIYTREEKTYNNLPVKM